MAYTANLRTAIGDVRACLERAGLGRQDPRFACHGAHAPSSDAPLVLVACSGGRDSMALAAVTHIVCGMLGLEPLYLACEGRLVIFALADKADALVEALRGCENSENAAIIGEVTSDLPGHVILRTEIGAQTMLSRPTGELLPRIC